MAVAATETPAKTALPLRSVARHHASESIPDAGPARLPARRPHTLRCRRTIERRGSHPVRGPGERCVAAMARNAGRLASRCRKCHEPARRSTGQMLAARLSHQFA
eukprot:scaffold41606_cov72-Phaeocystis_antarctica.AAC.3